MHLSPTSKLGYLSFKHRIVFVESITVCMPRMDEQCSNFDAKVMSLDASRNGLRYAWAEIRML